MRDTVLAVDPGVMTGWATWRPPEGFIFFRKAGQADFAEFVKRTTEIAQELSCVVCERYIIGAETLRKSRQTASLELIGFLRYITIREDIPFVLQAPGDAKKFATDSKLAAAGWWIAGQDHARDALRHLMRYLVRTGQMEPPRAC